MTNPQNYKAIFLLRNQNDYWYCYICLYPVWNRRVVWGQWFARQKKGYFLAPFLQGMSTIHFHKVIVIEKISNAKAKPFSKNNASYTNASAIQRINYY